MNITGFRKLQITRNTDSSAIRIYEPDKLKNRVDEPAGKDYDSTGLSGETGEDPVRARRREVLQNTVSLTGIKPRSGKKSLE